MLHLAFVSSYIMFPVSIQPCIYKPVFFSFFLMNTDLHHLFVLQWDFFFLFSTPWWGYSCPPMLPRLTVISCNLAVGIKEEIRSNPCLPHPPTPPGPLSSIVMKELRCLGCTVQIWQNGNEETLSPTYLDTIQIAFARIPAIYHGSLPFHPPMSPSLFVVHLSLSFLSSPPHIQPPHPAPTPPHLVWDIHKHGAHIAVTSHLSGSFVSLQHNIVFIHVFISTWNRYCSFFFPFFFLDLIVETLPH